MFKPLPPQQLLHDLLRYDGETGKFYWRKSVKYDMPEGCEAGCVSGNGYVRINIRGYGQLAAHRLAWVYNHGALDSDQEIDHIDNDPSNNRMSNLRLATSSQQKMNKRVQSNNRSGLKGAYYHAAHKGKKWRSQIRVEGRYVFLGYFHTAEEAHAAYGAAAAHYYGEFARVA